MVRLCYAADESVQDQLSEAKNRVCVTPHEQKQRIDELRSLTAGFVGRTTATAEDIGREYHKARQLGASTDATTALKAAIEAMRLDGSLKLVSGGMAGGIKVLDTRDDAFFKISEDQYGIYKGSAVMADKPAKHELSALGFLHEALDGAHLTVPLVSCVDVTVRDGAASRVYRVQAFSALAIGDATLRSGSDDGRKTTHVCGALRGPLEAVAAAFHLAPWRFPKGLDAVTVHSYELEVARDRDPESLLSDVGSGLVSVLGELGVSAGASSVSGPCSRLEQGAAAQGITVVLDPFRRVMSRYTFGQASEVGLPAGSAQDADGALLQVLPFDVEGHMLPSGERCIADTHRLCIPEVRAPAGDDGQSVAVVLRGDGSMDVNSCAAAGALSSDASILDAARRASGVSADEPSASVQRAPGTGCAVVSWAGSGDRVIMCHPSLYWTATGLTALFPPTAGSVLREAGVAAVSPDAAMGGGDLKRLEPASAELLSAVNLTKAAASVQRCVEECVAAGSDDVMSLRGAVKAGLHERGLGLRHVWLAWMSHRSRTGAATGTAVAGADRLAPGQVLECAYVCGCLPRPGSSAGLALEVLMALRRGVADRQCAGASTAIPWLVACLAGRASAVKGLGLDVSSRAGLAERLLACASTGHVVRSWLWQQRRTEASVKSSGLGGRRQSRYAHTEAGESFRSDAAAASLGLLRELSHRQVCGGAVGSEDVVLRRHVRLARRELGSAELGMLAAVRGIVLSGSDAVAWLCMLAEILVGSSRLPGALEAYERAMAIKRMALGDDHPHVGSTWGNIGNCRSDMGDYAGALEAYERAMAIMRTALGDDHPDVGSTWGNIGSCRSRMGDYAGALEPFMKASDIFARLGPVHRDRVASFQRCLEMCSQMLWQ